MLVSSQTKLTTLIRHKQTGKVYEVVDRMMDDMTIRCLHCQELFTIHFSRVQYWYDNMEDTL